MDTAGPGGAAQRRAARIGIAAAVAYILVVVGGAATLDGASPTWLGIAIALAAAALAVVFLTAGPLTVARREGVERTVQTRATSLAFFATMIAAITYGLLETFGGLQPISAWWYFALGMVLAAVVRRVLQHRMTS